MNFHNNTFCNPQIVTCGQTEIAKLMHVFIYIFRLTHQTRMLNVLHVHYSIFQPIFMVIIRHFMLTVQLPNEGHKNRLKHVVVISKNIEYSC